MKLEKVRERPLTKEEILVDSQYYVQCVTTGILIFLFLTKSVLKKYWTREASRMLLWVDSMWIYWGVICRDYGTGNGSMTKSSISTSNYWTKDTKPILHVLRNATFSVRSFTRNWAQGATITQECAAGLQKWTFLPTIKSSYQSISRLTGHSPSLISRKNDSNITIPSVPQIMNVLKYVFF